jgi:hypothetical protein
MKAMIAAFLACALIAVAAPGALHQLGYTTDAMRAGAAVRLGDATR